MRKTVCIILGFVGLVFFVLLPLRASIIAFLAMLPAIDPRSRIELLEHAVYYDPCLTPALEKIGDNWYVLKNPSLAVVSYGRAMACSPAQAALYFKYGQMLLTLGYPEGAQFIYKSAELEPYNPYFTAEEKRLKALRLPSL